MDKSEILEKIEKHYQYEKDWHTQQLQFYHRQRGVVKKIVKVLDGIGYELEMGHSSMSLKFEGEEEAREGRELVSNVVEGIKEWEKDFNVYDMSTEEPKWRWSTLVQLTEKNGMWIHIYPTSPKPECVPRLEKTSSTSRVWVCEKGG